MAASVQITSARPTDRIVGATDNSATRLAQSLAGVEDTIQPALMGLAKSAQEREAARAQADLLRTNGQKLADAVREGKIEKTQNPYYIQAYERGAGAVTGRAAVADLIDKSQTWEEKTNTVAYQKRFTEELGKLAQGYQASPDSFDGFMAAAQPLQAQALQQNEQFNVARINQEHDANSGQLATTAVLAAAQAAGGHPSPSQVYDALEPQRKAWLGTGGTQGDWDRLTINAITSAAYNTGNASLLDVLDDPRGGKGALSAIVGPDGQPVAASIETAKYRIEQAAENAGMSEIKARQHAAQLEGLKARDDVWDHFGVEFLKGNTSKQELQDYLLQKGYSPQGISSAYALLGKEVAGSLDLSKSLMRDDPSTLALFARANREGFSDQLQHDIADAFRKDEITYETATKLMSTATSRSNHLESEGRADARSARSDARAAAADARRLAVSDAKDLKESREHLSGTLATKLSAAGIHTLNSPKARKQFDKGLQDAESYALSRSGNDPKVAREAVEAYAAAYARSEITKHSGRRSTPKAAPSGGSNPRK